VVKLLSIISLILALVLFPPAALAVISNNAVPGDATYPIKRSLEDVIFAVASLNPTSKAWFSAARSDRRFTEFKTLVAEGKKGTDTLNELVEQTQIAASQIAQVTNKEEKAKLIEQLQVSIEKYDQGLEQFADSPPKDPVLPQATNTPLPTPTTQPGNQPTSIPTVQPTSTPTPSPAAAPTLKPTSTLHPSPRPTQAPVTKDEEKEKQKQKEIEEARKKLEEIKKELRERTLKKSSQSNEESKKKSVDEDKKDGKNDKNNHQDKSKKKDDNSSKEE